LADELTAAQAELARVDTEAKATPGRVPRREVRPGARRWDPERKRIHDAVRIAVYNAESALARLLAEHYPRAHHEARTLLAEIYTSPRRPPSRGRPAPRTHPPAGRPPPTRALAGLCAELTATRTTYPGTDLTLV
jgi:hypothetical protein